MCNPYRYILSGTLPAGYAPVFSRLASSLHLILRGGVSIPTPFVNLTLASLREATGNTSGSSNLYLLRHSVCNPLEPVHSFKGDMDLCSVLTPWHSIPSSPIGPTAVFAFPPPFSSTTNHNTYPDALSSQNTSRTQLGPTHARHSSSP
ncbi:hypothetical protein XA68_13263 [Ophiocordyceps unilateralis]|uniref:Uncharacterized protein n=1 Tax=Ophiocordyceps unilateralis TaxID=268505 RepID=A0A2A9PMS2_OPHUN|nr:hypothetical protein XA68_13263 [Ophiocordyceps unilateralis]